MITISSMNKVNVFLLGTYSVLLLIGVDNPTQPIVSTKCGNYQGNIGTLILNGEIAQLVRACASYAQG